MASLPDDRPPTTAVNPVARRRVLIVDDSIVSRRLVRRCLEFAGCGDAEFLEAADGAAALRLLEAQYVDILVTDLNMPVMDGFELLRAIADTAKIAPGAIVVVSSAATESIRVELAALNATILLPKPVSANQMAMALAPVLRSQQVRR
jgi:CheY-like chemotaxis protein